MAHYRKGADAERELIKALWSAGLAVLRVAGSGVNPLPCPDVVALSPKKTLAFECKAWKGNHLAISIENMSEELEWSERAGADFFIAWKVPRKGWLFVKPSAFHKTSKNYMLSLHEARKQNNDLNVIIGVQKKLELQHY